MRKASWAECSCWMGLAMSGEEARFDRAPKHFQARMAEESGERLLAMLTCMGWDVNKFARAQLYGEVN